MLKLSVYVAADLSAAPEEEKDPKRWFTIPGLQSDPAARGQPALFSQHSPPQPIRAWRPVCGHPKERTASSHRRPSGLRRSS